VLEIAEISYLVTPIPDDSRNIKDRRGKIRDHEDDCGEPEEGRIERLIRGCVIFSLEVDGEEPGDGGVERLDDDRHVPRDRGRERDEPIGRDPESINEVGDQEHPDDDIYQEVGDVRREVAGELSGKASCGWCVVWGGGRHGYTSGRDGVGSPKDYSPAGFLSYRLVTAV